MPEGRRGLAATGFQREWGKCPRIFTNGRWVISVSLEHQEALLVHFCAGDGGGEEGVGEEGADEEAFGGGGDGEAGEEAAEGVGFLAELLVFVPGRHGGIGDFGGEEDAGFCVDVAAEGRGGGSGILKWGRRSKRRRKISWGAVEAEGEAFVAGEFT